jgi:large subunit ribosomal protein L17
MRHRKSGRKLNRTASHRKALLRNMANQLIAHKEIKTTTEKAKEARSTVERLITYAKKGDLHHRRLAFGFLRNKDSIKVLFDEIAPALSDRQGGYTRVLKLGRRDGDGAPLSLLQLVGFEKLTDMSKTEKKKRTKKKAKIEAAPVDESVDDKSVKEESGKAKAADSEDKPDKESKEKKKTSKKDTSSHSDSEQKEKK